MWGRLLSSGVMPFALLGRTTRCERARWRPAWIDIGEVQGVELRPKNVAFGAKGGVGLFLLRTRARVLHNPRKGEVGILWRLGQAAREIVEAAGQPGIVFAERVDAKRDELARKEFRKR